MGSLETARVGVIGLGYVGLPVAIGFARRYPTVGFDLDADRIAELRRGVDRTLERSAEELAAVPLAYTDDPADLAACTVYIVAVPTPTDDAHRPDFRHLVAACRTVGPLLKHGDCVVFESTVYPGATEEVCVPVLEATSGKVFNRDFVVGYSPERINPGDRTRTFETVVKVTSGSTPEAAAFVDALYAGVVPAGTFRASSIKVAEAAKVIENTQRDLNIALVNELAKIFERLGLDTLDVLEAAGTKWNFLPFRPGLVGGHCIGVDPYYLTYKAQSTGYHPELILAGRRLNDEMGRYVARRLIKRLLARPSRSGTPSVLVMGLTFKENCADVRNSKVVDVVAELLDFGIAVDVYDPWVGTTGRHELPEGARLIGEPVAGAYDGALVAVAHQAFRDLGPAVLRAFLKPEGVLYDLKGILPREAADLRP